MPFDDHYAALGVSNAATPEEIKRAFRRLTLELHPDRWPGDEDAARRFQRITRAYDVLGDPAKRLAYDQTMERSLMGYDVAGGEVPDIGRLVDSLVGDLFGGRRAARKKGADLRYTLTVSLEEACLGCVKRIEFEARGRCRTCDGTGTAPGGEAATRCDLCGGRGEVKSGGILSQRSACGRCQGMGMIQTTPCAACRGRGHARQQRAFHVSVKPGTVAGAERVLKGEGEPGRFGGGPGDLRVTISVRQHPWLARAGESDIVCSVPVDPVTAARGARLDVPTLDGVATISIPPATQSGTRLRMRGKGVPRADGSAGHMYVDVSVETPVEVDDQVREALDRLAAAGEGSPAAFPEMARLRQYVEARERQEEAHDESSESG